MQLDLLFTLLVLILSVVVHEAAHGYMANWLGDPTARLQGRLTLNPLKHIDPLGSVVLPALFYITSAPFLIGYAKPVPYNPYNLRGRYGEGLVAFAGPGTNILIALFFALLIRVSGAQLGPELIAACATIVTINLVLALFNLIPIPPLDGSKVLSTLFGMISPRLERSYDLFRVNFERLGILTGLLLILAVFYFLAPYFSALIGSIFSLLTGIRI